MRRIYLASSWRNQLQPEYVSNLREWGHEVYDFQNPSPDSRGFHWHETGVLSNRDHISNFLEGLSHPIAEEGFAHDFDAMNWADTCVMLLPCGKSAHLELGWFTGRGRLSIVHCPGDFIEPELMYKCADYVTYTISSLRNVLQ